MKHKYLLLFFTFISSQLFAQDSTDFKHNYYISSGIYFPDVVTEVRIDSKRFGLGTVLSLENSFDFAEKPTLFRVDGYGRISKRSAFTASFFVMNRNSSKTLEREFNVKVGDFIDTTFVKGATINSSLDNNFIGLTYHYDAFRRPMMNAGFDVGARLTSFKMNFSFKPFNGEEKSYQESLIIPVLLIGLHTNGYLTPRLRGGYKFEFFRLNIDGIKGSVYDSKIMLEYYFIKNLALGVSYNSIAYNLDEFPLSENFTGKIKFQISGMECYLSARF